MFPDNADTMDIKNKTVVLYFIPYKCLRHTVLRKRLRDAVLSFLPLLFIFVFKKTCMLIFLILV